MQVRAVLKRGADVEARRSTGRGSTPALRRSGHPTVIAPPGRHEVLTMTPVRDVERGGRQLAACASWVSVFVLERPAEVTSTFVRLVGVTPARWRDR